MVESGYSIDRQINAIKREEMKAIRSVKLAAKKGDKDSAKVRAGSSISSIDWSQKTGYFRVSDDGYILVC